MELHQIPTTTTKPGVKATSTTLLFFGTLLLFILALLLLPTVTAPGRNQALMQAAAFVPLTTGSLIEIESETFNLGQMRIVAITATIPLTANLTAFTIHVEYDPAIIDYNNYCSVGSLFSGVCNNSDGDGIPPDVVSFSAVSVSGVNGVVRLGEVRFAGTGLGTTPLHLVVGSWSDANPDPPITIDGSITINPAATSTVTPSMTASPGPSPTASMTPTPSMTASPGPSPTASITPTPGPSPTASTTPPPTPTSPTATPSATASSTPTLTLTSSPDPTPTSFVTATATATATPTPPKEDEYFIYLPIVLKN